MTIPAGTLQFHLSMLNDRARTAGYIKCIRDVVRPGDTVLDIGTGTGIFALAAARAGARQVYAIEVGRVARLARHLIRDNGFEDRIRLIRGRSTDVWLPERADVLISELIGDEPLAERVVGVTRDALARLLKPGARLIPASLKILGLPVEVPRGELGKLTFERETLQRWHSWYGLEFSSLARIAGRVTSGLNFEHSINPYEMRDWRILSKPILLAHIDFATWQRPSIFARRTAVASEPGELDAIAVYFELCVGETTFLSTHPAVVEESNHWQSPLRVLANPIALSTGNEINLDYWYRRKGCVSGCKVSVVGHGH